MVRGKRIEEWNQTARICSLVYNCSPYISGKSLREHLFHFYAAELEDEFIKSVDERYEAVLEELRMAAESRQSAESIGD